ncbi:MAG: hypothetical protein ACXAB2_02750 [Candidatus Hodarchaeales archaeon]|jgi:hypothetical protein
MKRVARIPYEEISILSLKGITSNTKFQVFGKVMECVNNELSLSDGKENFTFSIEGIEAPKLDPGNVILIFGQKEDSELRLDKIMKINVEWPVFERMRALERK